MARPRFEKLPPEKQERILEAAAREFAAYGYDAASLNHILDAAGISKGAAYYYFEDKADLYATAVLHYARALMDSVAANPQQFTADNFWTQLAALYQRQFADFLARPWVPGLIKTANQVPPQGDALNGLVRKAQGYLDRILARGRALGVVRRDLPDDLLAALVMALDAAHDQWLQDQGEALDAEDLAAAADRMSDLLRRLLAPPGLERA